MDNAKYSRAGSVRLLILLAASVLTVLPWLPAGAVQEEAQCSVKGVEGIAEYLAKGSSEWKPLLAGATLGSGAAIRTPGDGAVDLFFPWSGTVLRLVADTELRLDKLVNTSTDIENITDTQLFLARGSVVGSQRKLPKASTFSIVTKNGEATIRGTEYVVRDDGAVSVLSGAVNVKYHNPGERGPKKFTVQEGQSFDPATRTVVPTTSEFLQNIAYHIDTVRHRTLVFHVSGHASVTVRPIKGVSPVMPSVDLPGVQAPPVGSPPPAN